MIGVVLSEIEARSPPAGDDGLQKVVLILFDKRHEVGVALDSNDENPLPRIPARVRMADNIEKRTGLDGYHDLLERQTALVQEPVVLAGRPAIRFHVVILSRVCRMSPSGWERRRV